MISHIFRKFEAVVLQPRLVNHAFLLATVNVNSDLKNFVALGYTVCTHCIVN